MHAFESPVEHVARGMRRSRLHASAKDCTRNIYVATARWKWPENTGANWAAAAGKKSERIGKYWLAGKVSAEGKLAIIHLFD